MLKSPKVLSRSIELISGSKSKILKKELAKTDKLYNKLVSESRAPMFEAVDPRSILYAVRHKYPKLKKAVRKEKGKVLAMRVGAGAGAYLGGKELLDKKAEFAFEKIARKKSNDAWKTLAAGSVAGAASATSVAPIDLVKHLKKTQPKIYGKLSTTGVIKKVYKEAGGGLKGIKELWRGNVPGMLKLAPAQAVSFAVFAAALSQLK